MMTYVVKMVLEQYGVEVLVLDAAWAPSWMLQWRLSKALEWISGESVEKPAGYQSIYSGYYVSELIVVKVWFDCIPKSTHARLCSRLSIIGICRGTSHLIVHVCCSCPLSTSDLVMPYQVMSWYIFSPSTF